MEWIDHQDLLSQRNCFQSYAKENKAAALNRVRQHKSDKLIPKVLQIQYNV